MYIIFMITPLFTYVLLSVTCILVIWNIISEVRIRRFTRGSNGKSLERTIAHVLQKIDFVEKENQALMDKNTELELRLRKSIRNIETVRFNPFADQGSNQSFATAFINDEKNGVVISTLFARDRTAIFAKPIINGRCDYELTQEEKVVLEKTLS